MKCRSCFFIVFLGAIMSVYGQSNVDVGLLPKINVSAKLSKQLKWVNSLEAREVIYDDAFTFTHSLVDITSIIAIKTDLNQSFNMGYVLRFKGGKTIHRLVQHYNYVQSLGTAKLAHRLGFEQFFSKHTFPQYRTRYRATLQQPLSGEKVDVHEWYVKLSHEYLWQFNAEDLEVRLSPYLGYRLNDTQKLELGLDYRLGKFLNGAAAHHTWWRFTWYVSF